MMTRGLRRDNLDLVKRSSRFFLLSFIILGVFAVVVTLGVYCYQYNLAVQKVSEKMNVWKNSDWQSHKNFDLLSKSIVAAEDPHYFDNPKLECGLVGLLKILFQDSVVLNCSPVVIHATKLVRPDSQNNRIKRLSLEFFIANALSGRPNDAFDIVFNKAYFGIRADGTPIDGFHQAAQFFYNKPITELSISQAAMLAGIVRGPSRYAPNKDLAQAKLRRDIVIDQMAASAFISEAAAGLAKSEAL